MKGTYTALMQSPFFNPAFNSAIFDGPIRIYFAQIHESLALKVYFSLQQKFALEMNRAKELHKIFERNVLLMLYPSSDSFAHSFESHTGLTASEELHENTIIGVSGPFEDEQLPLILDQVLQAFKDWETIPFPNRQNDAIL